MAANSLNREIAFQAAEATLREGERHVENTPNIIDQICADDSSGTFDPDYCSTYQTNPNPNEGDFCVNGYCTPVQLTQAYNPAAKPGDADYLYDRWLEYDTATDPNNLMVWSTAGRHLEYSNYSALGLTTAPKYVIEFMGFVDPIGVPPACTIGTDPAYAEWPYYCNGHPAMFRVTALAETSGGARVMLQSTYLKQL